jgi:hypothetical protein
MPVEVKGPVVANADVSAALVPPGGSPPVDGGAPDLPPTDEYETVEESGSRFVLDAFKNMSEDQDDDVPASPGTNAPASAQQPVAAPVTQPSVEPAPVVPPQAQPPAPASPVVSQPAAPAQQAAPTAAPPQAPASEPLDPFSSVRDSLAQNEEQFRTAVADTYYKITPQEMEQFLGGDSKIVSHALARVHMNAVGSVMAVLAQQMPVWVSKHLTQHQARAAAEEEFWAANPKLDRNQHRALVGPIVNTYKHANPSADKATIHRMVGLLVGVAAGIPMEQLQAAAVAAPNGNGHVAPRAPAQPVVHTPGRQVRQVAQAASPAGVNAPVSGQQPVASANTWERMSEIFMADDRGEFEVR